MPRFSRVSILGLAAALAVAPAVATAASAPAPTVAPDAHACAASLNAAVYAYVGSTHRHDARAFESLMAPAYTAVLPGGYTFAGKAVGSQFINGFFARTDWTQTFRVTRTAVQGCTSALVLFDSTYTDEDGPVPLVIGLTWIYDSGRWQVLLDQNTVTDG